MRAQYARGLACLCIYKHAPARVTCTASPELSCPGPHSPLPMTASQESAVALPTKLSLDLLEGWAQETDPHEPLQSAQSGFLSEIQT